MTTPKQTNAQLLRRAEKAERQLQFEQIRAEKAWQSYGEALRGIVELRCVLRLSKKH